MTSQLMTALQAIMASTFMPVKQLIQYTKLLNCRLNLGSFCEYFGISGKQEPGHGILIFIKPCYHSINNKMN